MPGPIRTAILSVSDKTGVGELAQHLHQMGVKIYSTGGTLRALDSAGVKAIPIDELTQFPEMMDGRIKTLHPSVFAGLLARRDHPKDMDTLEAHRLKPIDMVVVNLDPFQQVAGRTDIDEVEALDHIDIGGPSMLRAAAKNFLEVVPVVDPTDYAALIDEMLDSAGEVCAETRRRLALKVFANTAEYDAAIREYFARTLSGG